MPKKTAKVLTRRKKFIEVEIPLTRTKIELIGNTPKDVEGKTIKLDLTRQLRGKSIEATLKIKIDSEGKAIAYPKKITLMPYFIRRMIRKSISYVEDSFTAPTQESLVKVKPFLITRKKVSRVVRKTLRNKAKNWLEDYLSQKKDSEIFSDILSNRLQKPLSLKLKKTYPLSLCEIRVLEIIRPLQANEIPKIDKKKEEETEKAIDQVREIEEHKIKKAEKEIKEAQEKAAELEKKEEKPEKPEKKPEKKKAPKKKTTAKKTESKVKKKTKTKKKEK